MRRLIPLVVAFAFAFAPALMSQRPEDLPQRMPKGAEVAQRPEDKPKADDPVKPDDPKHPRGHKPLSPEQSAKMHSERKAVLGNHVEKLAKAIIATWDCRSLGMVLPGNDQRQCGDCFGVSTADGASMCLIMAGILPNDTSKGRLSSQYGLDNPSAFEGGCNGGNGSQVIDYMIKSAGWPLTSDYGPYTASPSRLKPLTGMKLYKPLSWGFCTPNQEGGVASVQDIKNCMVKYGPINVSFDAGGCDSYRWPSVMKGRGNNVDHEVLCIGWDDSKNAFLGMNQWGDQWGGPDGTFWIDYSSYSWGTDAFWCTAGPPVPPVPPIPPIPPVPPIPGGLRIVSTSVTLSDGNTYTSGPQISATMTLGDLLKLINAPAVDPNVKENADLQKLLDLIKQLQEKQKKP